MLYSLQDGKTALKVAQERGHTDVIRVLEMANVASEEYGLSTTTTGVQNMIEIVDGSAK